jgi:hypothetical protein
MPISAPEFAGVSEQYIFAVLMSTVFLSHPLLVKSTPQGWKYVHDTKTKKRKTGCTTAN